MDLFHGDETESELRVGVLRGLESEPEWWVYLVEMGKSRGGGTISWR